MLRKGRAMVIEEKAYAKINLFLDVLRKRKDGYHDIRSVMHAVDLFDEVILDFSSADYACVTLKVEGEESLGDPMQNLAYIAAGRCDIFFELLLSPWDFAAGLLLITEAGGIITMENGEVPDFSKKCPIFASNGKFHENLLKIAKKYC